jgi:hypothetical protein
MHGLNCTALKSHRNCERNDLHLLGGIAIVGRRTPARLNHMLRRLFIAGASGQSLGLKLPTSYQSCQAMRCDALFHVPIQKVIDVNHTFSFLCRRRSPADTYQ